MEDLWKFGAASLGTLFSTEECEQIVALYEEAEHFRSRIEMARYRFGRGEYQYFAYPLPERVEQLRQHLYGRLVPVANEWMEALGIPVVYPAELDAFLAQCHEAGQLRPTPLLLRYGVDDFNCLHQDIYGKVSFPFQVIVQLSRDFTGGELLLVEQRPRAQSAGQVLRPEQGEGVVIATRYRPAAGKHGFSRTQLRHGVARVRSGQRWTLGVIFHDAI
ncbi:2OG-Fe(II) oxygenase [Bryobacter aggregatus]|uniref:2OG-Fe(II) oxygenase n=1 Tax=Bryobacter aggregatus TaxID=360054 RepID=UPI0009B5A523|nr:2OG-Fe(II) oxygenase [Bryobacter aggregatus]